MTRTVLKSDTHKALENWESLTIENANVVTLQALFKPPKRKKRKKYKRKKYLLDSRLGIWKKPRAKSNQRWFYAKYRRKRTLKLIMRWILYKLN